MMTPYPQTNLTADKRIYNYRHNLPRRISENLFGIIAKRWRIYFTTTRFFISDQVAKV